MSSPTWRTRRASSSASTPAWPARSSAASRSSRTRATSPTSATTPPCAPTKRPDLEPLPHLFVVIDEFGELLTAKPDFIDLFLSIGRIGRSIGVHLLLSSQRIEGGKLKGLDTYLSYRLGLRTFSADESRTVLDTTDAFHLPPLPGFGYLKVDTSHYERFKASYVSGAYRGPVQREDDEDTGPLALAVPDLQHPRRRRGVRRAGRAGDAARGRPARPSWASWSTSWRTPPRPVRRIWLPPLPDAIALDTVAGPVEVGRARHAARQATRPAAGAAGRARRPGQAVAGPVVPGPDASRAATPPSSAARSPARPPCCAPSPSRWP